MKQEERDKRFTEEGDFSYHSEGFNIIIKNVIRVINWSDIKRISAYKVDLFTMDEICMEIIWKDSALTITEETRGWYLFIEKFTATLEGVNKNWESEVIKEAFATDWTVVYERTTGKQG